MIIVYHCYGGSHSSVTSAGIHLELLPRNRVANAQELLQVPHYDSQDLIKHGHFRFVGRDADSNIVYVLGKRTLGRRVTILLYKIANLFDRSEDVYIVDTTKPINILMVVGGFLSRGLKITFLGRPLVILGTKLAYKQFIFIVKKVKKDLEKRKLINKIKIDKEKSLSKAVFYICSDIFRFALLTAGCHLNPGMTKKAALKWLKSMEFDGGVGDITFLGTVEEHDIYLIGADGEPGIVSRILKEFRCLLEIPQTCYFVVEQNIPVNFLIKGIAVLLKFFRWKRALRALEGHILRKSYYFCLHEASKIRILIKEGILD